MRYDTIIDSRDLANRLEELRQMKQAVEEAEDRLEEARIAMKDVEEAQEDGEARLTEVEKAQEEFDRAEEALKDAKEAFGEDKACELKDLENAESEIPEFTSGNALVPNNEWIQYVKDMLEDCGDIPESLPPYVVIDWEATASNIAADYSEIEIQGTTFLYRNC